VSTQSALEDVLPAGAVTGPDASASYGRLADGAEAVVHPRSTEEVVEVVRWAAAHEVGILAVGSGARARPPRRDGRYVVLTTDRLSGIEIYEPADVTLTAKAGTSLPEIERALGAHGQWLPFDPPDVSQRTLGGLVAAGESGPVATGYGELRSHVLGATVVCGDGRVLRLGGRVVKNVAGFDLLRPMVGSRGRLGVITSVCLRAFPVPAEDRVLALRAGEVGELADAARAVRTAPILPASAAVWSRGGSAEAVLLVRLHGGAATVDADQMTLARQAGVDFERVSDGRRLLDEVRDGAGSGPTTVHVALLPARVFDGLAAARRRLAACDVFADAYGGAARVAVDSPSPSELAALRGEIEALGGTMVVEGPAAVDPADISSRPSEAELELAGRLENVFDPPGVFWPCRA
jgi:glycolate oxidase FAD binding subunit